MMYQGKGYDIVASRYVEGLDGSSVFRVCALVVRETSCGRAFIESDIWPREPMVDLTPQGASVVQTMFYSADAAVERSAEIVDACFPGAIVLTARA